MKYPSSFKCIKQLDNHIVIWKYLFFVVIQDAKLIVYKCLLIPNTDFSDIVHKNVFHRKNDKLLNKKIYLGKSDGLV